MEETRSFQVFWFIIGTFAAFTWSLIGGNKVPRHGVSIFNLLIVKCSCIFLYENPAGGAKKDEGTSQQKDDKKSSMKRIEEKTKCLRISMSKKKKPQPSKGATTLTTPAQNKEGPGKKVPAKLSTELSKMSTEEAASTSESLILQNQCSPSSIISEISKRSETEMFVDENKLGEIDSPLQNYKTMIDGNLRTIYIEAEVHFSNLDNGYDPTEYGITRAKIFGEPGDIPTNFIPKKLGGDGEIRHVYPANPNADFGKSEIHQNLVYDHVKKGGDRFAELFFGVIYEEGSEEEIKDEDYDEDDDTNYFRPKEIVYKFELYENDKIVGETLEGKIINMLP